MLINFFEFCISIFISYIFLLRFFNCIWLTIYFAFYHECLSKTSFSKFFLNLKFFIKSVRSPLYDINFHLFLFLWYLFFLAVFSFLHIIVIYFFKYQLIWNWRINFSSIYHLFCFFCRCLWLKSLSFASWIDLWGKTIFWDG